MGINFRQLLRAFILVGFAALFIKLHYTGDIEKLINPKYDLTSKIAAGALVFLFIVQLMRVWEIKQKMHESCSDCSDHNHDSGSFIKRFIGYAIIIFPLVTGFLLAPVTLDASIAAKKSTILTRGGQNEDKDMYEEKTIKKEANGSLNSTADNNDSSDPSNDAQVEHQTPMENNNYFSENEYDKAMEGLHKSDVIQMDENIYGAYYEEIDANPKAFVGKKFKINGFVYREQNLGPNQLVLARFYMVHCVADTSVIGFLNEFEEAGKLEEDTWLEIEGTLDITTYNGFELPVIKVDNWTVIEEPDDPYIYPPLIQLVGG